MVRRLSGEEVAVGQLLDLVQEIVTDYALFRILHDGRVGDVGLNALPGIGGFGQTAEGGTGAVEALTDPMRLGDIILRTRELLHEGDPTGGCERACYECLRTFRNQFIHHLLDRTLVLPALQALEALEVNPVQQPSAGLSFEELEAQCQSDFEREVLAAIRDRGLPLPDEAQKTIYDGDEPIATVDFFYAPRILVFVDGSPHYRDYIQAADTRKRRRLKALGYRVVVVMAENPEAGLSDLAARVGG